jgi:hypothetical protein
MRRLRFALPSMTIKKNLRGLPVLGYIPGTLQRLIKLMCCNKLRRSMIQPS